MHTEGSKCMHTGLDCELTVEVLGNVPDACVHQWRDGFQVPALVFSYDSAHGPGVSGGISPWDSLHKDTSTDTSRPTTTVQPTAQLTIAFAVQYSLSELEEFVDARYLEENGNYSNHYEARRQ